MSVTVQPGAQLRQLADVVEEHENNLSEFDALDQAEILCAGAIITAREGRAATSYFDRLKPLLATLPRGVEALLKRLCFLPDFHDYNLRGVLTGHRLIP
jgi:hypothetical protein